MIYLSLRGFSWVRETCNAKPEIGENKGSNSTSMNFTWRATKTSEDRTRGKAEERRIREN